MRFCVICSLVLVLGTVALAQDLFLKDVPRGHWANEAIYGLIKRGITGGYPDGTYRGQRHLSRYESAAFLSKFFQSFQRQRAVNEKYLEEFKTELALIKYQQDKAKLANNLSGTVESVVRAALLPLRGGQLSYRLKLTCLKTFDPASALQLSLDTIDAGFNSAINRDLAAQLLNLESVFQLAAWRVKATLGPGQIEHLEPDQLFPSENHTVFDQPRPALELAARTDKLDFAAAYVVRQLARSGRANVQEVTAKLGLTLGAFYGQLRPRYVFAASGGRDSLLEANLDFAPSQSVRSSVRVAAGSFQSRHSWYFKFLQQFVDLGGRGTDLTLRFDKVGSSYRAPDLDKVDFIELNNFKRWILDGSVDLGLQFRQRVTSQLALEWLSDYVLTGGDQYGAAYPGTYWLWQAGLNYQLNQQASSQLCYRSYNVPSGVAQFAQAVPLTSGLVEWRVNCGF